MASAVGSVKAATGHSTIPIANDRNTEDARKRIRWEHNDILYPGALTSRLKRYAAEPAPDGANLTSNDERTANGTEKLDPASAPARSGVPGFSPNLNSCSTPRIGWASVGGANMHHGGLV